MTFTTTVVHDGVFGDLKYKMYSVANDGTSGTITTGLRSVYNYQAQNISSVDGIKLTESAGVITAVTTSGDDFLLEVKGK